jgi:hypothetical protein
MGEKREPEIMEMDRKEPSWLCRRCVCYYKMRAVLFLAESPDELSGQNERDLFWLHVAVPKSAREVCLDSSCPQEQAHRAEKPLNLNRTLSRPQHPVMLW